MIDVPIQVKDVLREGRLRKNYRFQVLNDDGTVDFTIDNDNLVSESVNIDERMCSGDTIKFGLCEGSSLEFQYFGKENITGRQLKVFVDVNCSEGDYTNVGQFERMETIIITDPGNYRVYSADENAYDLVWVNRGGTYTQYSPMSSDNETEVVFYDLQAGDELEVEWSGQVYDTYLQKGDWHLIPMGYFTVKNCSRQASTGIIKAVCYNKLQSDYLDAKANEFISETFRNLTSVYVGDVINELLKEYAIAPYKQMVITPSEGQTSATRNQTATVKFKQLYGDHVLNATPWYPETPPTTSTNLSVLCNYKLSRWELPGEYIHGQTVYNNAVQIRVPADADEIDDAVYQFMVDTLKDCFTSSTVTALINELMNYVGSGYIFEYQKKWGFGIRVEFGDGTEEYYGSTLFKNGIGRGTFADLNKITLLNVKAVYFTQYDRFEFNYNSNGVDLRCYGESYRYLWSEERPQYESNIHEGHYYLPTFEGRTGTPLITEETNVYILENYNDMSKQPLTIDDLADVTLRDLQSSVYETVCQFGQLSRETDLFSGVELNRSRLLPADTLYPDNVLYPYGAQESAFRSQYSKLWADEGNVRKWRYLIITYKGLDENQQEKDFTLQRTVNADGTDDYNCSDNWLFRNLVWTAADIGTYADAMVLKMRDITWFPFEMWCAGLPYLETGDEIEIPLGEDTYTSYILQRQLRGIQNLQDTYINGTLDIF